jgi:hypothetical protein
VSERRDEMPDPREEQEQKTLGRRKPSLSVEELLEAGEVRAALLLKGDWDEGDRKLALDVWEAGLAVGDQVIADLARNIRGRVGVRERHSGYEVWVVPRSLCDRLEALAVDALQTGTALKPCHQDSTSGGS